MAKGLVLAAAAATCFASSVMAHSWVDCFDWRMNVPESNKWNDDDGTCEGFNRRWPAGTAGRIQALQVESEYYFWKKEGEVRDGYLCKTTLRNGSDSITEERGNPVSAAYGGDWEPMASKGVGDELCIRWIAKNHKAHVDNDQATNAFGNRVTNSEVFIYIAKDTSEPSDWHNSAKVDTYEVPFANCPDPGPSSGSRDAEGTGSNLAMCGACITVPQRAPGVYSIGWEWYLGGVTYGSCGDIEITGGGGTSAPTSPPAPSPPPAAQPPVAAVPFTVKVGCVARRFNSKDS
jgi:hypothetical protein